MKFQNAPGGLQSSCQLCAQYCCEHYSFTCLCGCRGHGGGAGVGVLQLQGAGGTPGCSLRQRQATQRLRTPRTRVAKRTLRFVCKAKCCRLHTAAAPSHAAATHAAHARSKPEDVAAQQMLQAAHYGRGKPRSSYARRTCAQHTWECDCTLNAAMRTSGQCKVMQQSCAPCTRAAAQQQWQQLWSCTYHRRQAQSVTVPCARMNMLQQKQQKFCR